MTFRDITRPFRRIGRKIRKGIKSKYGKAKIFILAAGLILVTAAGILATGILKQPGIDIYQPAASAGQPGAKIASAMNETAGTINFESTADVNTKPEADATISGNITLPAEVENKASGNEESSMTVQAKTAVESSNQPAAQPSVTLNEAAATTGTTDIIQVGEQPVPASGDWLELRIEKHKAEIQSQDLEDFRAITAKLDQTYVQSLSIDGFTVEEQAALKDYLHSKLTETEYGRAKQLFSTYSYLMEEE